MIQVIEADILKSSVDIIVQQVNCLGRMGGGLAYQIQKKYPEVKKEYHKHYNELAKKKGFDRSKLLGTVQFVDVYDGKIVANVFGQELIREGELDTNVYTKTWALIKGLEEVKTLAEKHGFKIAIPTYIGCGLANGDWNEIKAAIEAVFDDGKVNVVFYNYGRKKAS